MEFKIVQKYWEYIDDFIKLRVFPKEEVEKLLENCSISGKNSYIQLVINTCVVNYNDSILPRWLAKAPSSERSKVEDSLYRLCVSVNPQLNIRKVILPADVSEDKSDGFLLIEKGVGPRTGLESKRIDLDRLEKRICRRIVGQDKAVHAVFQALRKARVGLKDPKRPLGAYLFLGRTGVGKTEMAKALVQGLFNNPSRLIRIDCPEYALPHEYAKLIGSPPGYVGFELGGALTEKGKCSEPCILLFDEIEKAHVKIHHLLLQLMDEGFITDAKGAQVTFTNSLIILTSNLGTAEIDELEHQIGFRNQKGAGLTQKKMRAVIIEALKRAFVPEFLNRLDEIILFRSLQIQDCLRIADLFLRELARNLRNIGLHLFVPQKVKEFLAREGYNEEYGAREIRRVIRQHIENPLAERILEGKFPRGASIRASLRSGRVCFTARERLGARN